MAMRKAGHYPKIKPLEIGDYVTHMASPVFGNLVVLQKFWCEGKKQEAIKIRSMEIVTFYYVSIPFIALKYQIQRQRRGHTKNI